MTVVVFMNPAVSNDKMISSFAFRLLEYPFCDGEHQFCASYMVAQSVVFDVLVYDHGNSENSAFLQLFLLVLVYHPILQNWKSCAIMKVQKRSESNVLRFLQIRRKRG